MIRIGEGIPSRGCLEANADALARYAALCQEAGLVPIVEPEVLMEGEHTIKICSEITERVLRTVFNFLYEERVMLEGILSVEEEHANDMHDLLVAHEGKPFIKN